jgi:SAM-dependent methyltransferase
MNQPLSSSICRYDHFESEWYSRAREALRLPPFGPNWQYGWRKAWEWAAIYETLAARGMLVEGKSGIGFAVGTEMLPSVFASRGVSILASDLELSQSNEAWTETDQHAGSIEALFKPDYVDRSSFDRLVKFQPVDMNDLSALPSAAFDFAWSSCAFEHIGNVDDGLNFVVNAMRLLKPGGVAVHTTEFDVSSNDVSCSIPHASVYRRQDIERLDYMLRPIQCGLEYIDYNPGHHANDLNYDRPPFMTGAHPHIKLEFLGHVVTSILLIVRKA